MITVETDADYLSRVVAAADPEARVRLRTMHADVGPTREWGFPSDPESIEAWRDYAAAPWRDMVGPGWTPDCVLVDGRFRAAAFLESLSRLREGAVILFDDFYDRPQYWGVMDVVEPAERSGRMARFVVPALTAADRSRIAALLPGFSLDPA